MKYLVFFYAKYYFEHDSPEKIWKFKKYIETKQEQLLNIILKMYS